MADRKRDFIEIQVGDRLIGEGHPVYMIAEMSANHAGSLERAKEIIHAAAESGADCIKVQTYTPDTLTIDCSNSYFQVKNGTWEGENLYQLYGKGYMPWEWQGILQEEAGKAGIDFLSTPFDKTSVDFLEELGVAFYKIASFEMVDLPLVEYVASKGKPVILSTGLATLEEIHEAVDAVYSTGNRQLALLRCSSVYPADPERMNLSTIRDMVKQFGIPIGLSDHSLGTISAVTAVGLGAKIIEKHFCISREIENPDASFSMTPGEYRDMVTQIRMAEKAIGQPSYGVAEEEKSSMVFRRSIFAVKDIAKGETLTEENIRIIRPGYGLKPKYYRDICGMKADRDLERGTPLSFEALEKGAILFATNNDNTADLQEWLASKEGRVFRIENKLTVEMVRELQPSFVISFNYRHLVSKEVLELLPDRVINLHISLLPYNRGSSPNFFSFMDDTPKGVTIHLMDKGLDTGDILCQKEVKFDESQETFTSSYEKLMQEVKDLFKENWEDIRDGRITPVKQSGIGTYNKMRELEVIQEQVPFQWGERIAEFKERYRKEMP
ncbi:MAG: pseudaminic acid synthase [Lachnospiraceae bacterium]|jgi:pseudaminic acid synthase|nr:pseudaminic acid synthase [Lachnospiraceae bacterium]